MKRPDIVRKKISQSDIFYIFIIFFTSNKIYVDIRMYFSKLGVNRMDDHKVHNDSAALGN